MARLGGTLVQRLTGTPGTWAKEPAEGVGYLHLAIDPTDAKGATANAWYYAPNSDVSQNLGQVRFNPSVLVAEVDAAMAEARLPCSTNAALGVSALGSRRGAGGLEISLPAGAIPETVCSGDILTLPISTNAAAKAQIYLVDPAGTAFLVGDGGAIGGHLMIPGTPWTKKIGTSAYPDGRPEQLVVVAEPAGDLSPAALTWRGDCKVDDVFSPILFSVQAALTVHRFHVAPAGTGRCPSVPAVAAPTSVAVCGTGRMVSYP